ncbi:hypothetical protein CKAH01_08211 [Colletotrichum kahawae]|uniref:Uncharacterized protein n=1 Tax=Colletotrichum kahawae TaxID=34407 RepID=A0AAE0D1W7_COLKA|nr:hypothetical protein CKAH01_08211 [Colletotrichum kahawae]
MFGPQAQSAIAPPNSFWPPPSPLVPGNQANATGAAHRTQAVLHSHRLPTEPSLSQSRPSFAPSGFGELHITSLLLHLVDPILMRISGISSGKPHEDRWLNPQLQLQSTCEQHGIWRLPS